MSPAATNSTDTYTATAGAYDLFNQPFRQGQSDALKQVIPRFVHSAGPVLDIGAGSCLNTVDILESDPDSAVLAIEPSASMRSLLLGKIAHRPDWYPRVSVRPEILAQAPLPERIAGAVLTGVIGHFSSAERAWLFRALAQRLPEGAPVLFDLQPPETPQEIPQSEFTNVTVGSLRYLLTGQAQPIGGDRMRWTMTYTTLEGVKVLHEASTSHIYHHPPHSVVDNEAEAAGFSVDRLPDSTFWVATRPATLRRAP